MLTSLRVLNLGGTQVTDVTPLLGLTRLERVNLTSTPVDPADLARLRAALPGCSVQPKA